MIRDTYRAFLVVVVACILAGDLPGFLREPQTPAVQMTTTPSVATRTPVRTVAQPPARGNPFQPPRLTGIHNGERLM